MLQILLCNLLVSSCPSPPYSGSLKLSSCKRLEPPVFVESLRDCCVDEGSDIILRGVITGSPPISITWLHNGEQEFGRYLLSLYPSRLFPQPKKGLVLVTDPQQSFKASSLQRHSSALSSLLTLVGVGLLWAGEVARFGKPSFDGTAMSFVVRESLPEDAGAYTCLAENRAGKTSCCAAVFVRGEGCC